MDERTLQHALRLAAGRLPNSRLFRNTTGKGYNIQGISDAQIKRVISAAGGKAVNVTYGLCVGSADEIGWHSFIVQPEHVGQRVARFTAFELKSATGKLTPEQKMFLDTVNRFGGLAAEIRSVEQALELLGEP